MNHITALPFSPFVDETQVNHDNRFVLNEDALFEAIRAESDHWPYLDAPVWPVRDDPPPLFIGAPSDEFIEACHRDLLPLLERAARRG